MIGRYADLNVYQEIFKSRDFYKLSGGAILIPLAMAVDAAGYMGGAKINPAQLLLIVSILVNGSPIVVNAVKGIVARQMNVDELVSIAILACVFTGNFFEAAIVSAIMVFGAFVEEMVSDSARDAIKKLMEAAPKTAVVERDGKEVEVDVARIRKDEILAVRQGQVIAVDGEVVDGQAGVQEASVTGESIPASKGPGEFVYGGTICTEGFLRVRAKRVGEDSTIGQIIQMVKAAEQSKVRGAKIVDTYASWFTPVILLAALVVLLATGDITRAITVLIVGCPCSFLLAGPVSTVAAVGRAAKSGIIVKGGQYLENVARAKVFCFDKTGTLTTGHPVVADIKAMPGVSRNEVLKAAASVEKKSLHPLALSIVSEAEASGLVPEDACDIETRPGKGISGRVDGKWVELETSPGKSDHGYTSVDIRQETKLIGQIFLEDAPRSEAAMVVAAIRGAGVKKVVMISGDNESAVGKTAESTGISTWFAGQHPKDKLDKLAAFSKDNLVYVGDGVNDAPALKTADTGIAMGGAGAPIALETADIVLMNDTLSQLPFLIRLSRSMARIIKISIGLSLVINMIAVGAGALGWLTPIMGAIVHNIGSVLVVILAASIRFMPDEGGSVRRPEMQ